MENAKTSTNALSELIRALLTLHAPTLTVLSIATATRVLREMESLV